MHMAIGWILKTQKVSKVFILDNRPQQSRFSNDRYKIGT